MIPIEEAIQIHALLIQKFGGTTGLRDREALLSALIRPYQLFEGNELYPSPEEKAAALLESIISNHPFLDGNKRLGYVLMKLTLLESKINVMATHDDLYQFIIDIAKGNLNIAKITAWIKIHAIRNEP